MAHAVPSHYIYNWTNSLFQRLDNGMASPNQAPARPLTIYLKAALLIVPQVLLSVIAVAWVRLTGMAVAGCETRCEYAASYAANVGLWIVLALLAGLAFAFFVVAERRGWSKWPIVVAGLALTVLATFIATQVVEWAYIP